jgi:hypothetical protein
MDRAQLARLIGVWILVGISVLIIVTDACLIGMFIYDHCSYNGYAFSGKVLACVDAEIASSTLMWCNGTAEGYSDRIRLQFTDIPCPGVGSACPVLKIGRLELARRWLPRPSSECVGMDLAWVITALIFSAFLLPFVWVTGLAIIRWVGRNDHINPFRPSLVWSRSGYPGRSGSYVAPELTSPTNLITIDETM